MLHSVVFFWAMCLVMLAYHCYVQKKKTMSLVCLVLAPGIHMSAFVLIFVWILGQWVYKNSLIRNGVIISMELLFLPFLSSILGVVGLTYAAAKMQYYLNNDRYDVGFGGLLFLFVYTIQIIWGIYLIRRLDKEDKINEVILRMNKGIIFVLPLLLFNYNFGIFFL